MTPITDFYDPVRFLLGDHDDTARLYEDSAIARGVRTCIKGGLIPKYAISADQITPDVATPNDYLLIAAHCARLFQSANPEHYSYRTRAIAETIGGGGLFGRGHDFDLAQLIYRLENGDMFDGWQSFASWLQGYSGVSDQWLHLVRLKLTMPFQTVTVDGGSQ